MSIAAPAFLRAGAGLPDLDTETLERRSLTAVDAAIACRDGRDIDAGTERCGVVVSYAFLIMREIQIRNTAPMIATTIVPMNPPA